MFLASTSRGHKTEESTPIPGAPETPARPLVKKHEENGVTRPSKNYCVISYYSSGRGSVLISSNMSWRRKAPATAFAVCSVRG